MRGLEQDAFTGFCLPFCLYIYRNPYRQGSPSAAHSCSAVAIHLLIYLLVVISRFVLLLVLCGPCLVT